MNHEIILDLLEHQIFNAARTNMASPFEKKLPERISILPCRHLGLWTPIGHYGSQIVRPENRFRKTHTHKQIERYTCARHGNEIINTLTFIIADAGPKLIKNVYIFIV